MFVRSSRFCAGVFGFALGAALGTAGAAYAGAPVGDGAVNAPSVTTAEADPLAFAPDSVSRFPVDSRRGPMWMRSFDQTLTVASGLQSPGYIQRATGLVTGVDFAVDDDARAGGAIGRLSADAGFNATSDRAFVDSWQGTLYGWKKFDRFYVAGQTAYGRHDVSTKRTIELPALAGDGVALARYASLSWSASSEVGAIWRAGRVNLQPSFALAYAGSHNDGFTEAGPDYALAVGASGSDGIASTLAFRAAGSWKIAGAAVTPDLKLGWRHEFGDERRDFTANFIENVSPAAAMSIASCDIGADSLTLSSSATFVMGQDTTAFVTVNGQYNADADATSAMAGLRVVW